MAATAADIVSVFLDPVSGTVTNLGSTATHFGADLADDSVSGWQAVKNLGLNLAFDTLSVIPIIGDAAGTGSKVLRSAKNLAKVALGSTAIIGTLNTVANGPQIINSLKKVTNPNEKLTVEDWKNIAQGFQTLAGGAGVARGYNARRIARNNSRVKDSIGVTTRDAAG